MRFEDERKIDIPIRQHPEVIGDVDHRVRDTSGFQVAQPGGVLDVYGSADAGARTGEALSPSPSAHLPSLAPAAVYTGGRCQVCGADAIVLVSSLHDFGKALKPWTLGLLNFSKTGV